MKAMLLAAGLGTRMAPVSKHRAKPTLPILDRPLLRWLVDSLAEQGVTEIVANAHTHAKQIREALAGAPIPVQISPEPALLGSGGGLLAARDLLDDSGTFLLVNADMYLEVDLADMLATHRRSGSLATLVLWPDAAAHAFGTIGYGNGGLVRRITDLVDRGGEQGCGLFCGVHAMEPEVFDYLSARKPASGRLDLKGDFWVPMLESGEKLAAWQAPDTAVWWPVGTPRELLEANLAALERFATGKDAWVGPDAIVPASAQIGPGAVIGAGAVVPEHAVVQDALLLPGARPAERELVRAIAFDGEVWRDG